jgi:hypothetical protein
MSAVTTVLVDARNVLRSQWPNIPEGELVELLRAWAAANRKRVVAVFDGRAPAAVGDEQLEIVGTGAESADDWLIRTAAELEGPYWLVTSDRALRDVAGAAAERTIGGGSFARELKAADAR